MRASSSAVRSAPSPQLLTCQFWQKSHCSVHPVKNTVPEPPVPVMGGSSPKCRQAQAARMTAPCPQYPVAPVFLSTRQSRGHKVQSS